MLKLLDKPPTYFGKGKFLDLSQYWWLNLQSV